MKLRKLILKDKRGLGIGDLYPIILTITLVAMLLAISIYVLVSWQGVTANVGGTTVNETAWINNTIYSVTNRTACAFNTFAVTSAVNGSGSTIPAANYVVNANLGTIVNGTAIDWNQVNLTYTYKYGGADCNSIATNISQFTTFIPWIGVILLIVAAAIVLGIVISSFAGGRNSRV